MGELSQLFVPVSILEKLKKSDPAIPAQVLQRAEIIASDRRQAELKALELEKKKFFTPAFFRGLSDVFSFSARQTLTPVRQDMVKINMDWKNTNAAMRQAVTEIMHERKLGHLLTLEEKQSLDIA